MKKRITLYYSEYHIIRITLYYLYTKNNNEIMPFAATGMDVEMIILSEVNQKEKDKNHIL